MKIIITGGYGFIGSALIRMILSNSDDQVLNIDKLTYAADINSLKDFDKNKNYQFNKTDICNTKEITKIFNSFKPDAVIHLAAESHVDRSISDSSNFIQTNIFGTYNLLEVTRNYIDKCNASSISADNFRFLHVSTDEVYGDLKLHDHPFTESNSYEPSSPYSASKASSDHLVRAWNRTYKIPTLITNCSNNYGPFQNFEKFIPQVIKSILLGSKIPIYGDGLQIRDWLFVDDHVEALYLVLKSGKIGETYNIGGNNEIKNIEIVQTICNILETYYKDPKYPFLKKKNINFFNELISFVEDRKGHDRRYAIDSSKIHNDLSWDPKENFNSGLNKTIEWYMNQYISEIKY